MVLYWLHSSFLGFFSASKLLCLKRTTFGTIYFGNIANFKFNGEMQKSRRNRCNQCSDLDRPQHPSSEDKQSSLDSSTSVSDAFNAFASTSAIQSVNSPTMLSGLTLSFGTGIMGLDIFIFAYSRWPMACKLEKAYRWTRCMKSPVRRG